jgi:predicted NBD/HSP70 family sugar kinase
MKVLMIDVGGTSVKMMASGHEGFRKIPSGETMTASQMVKQVLAATEDWTYEAVSLGFPGKVSDGEPAYNPPNLGGGWVGFEFAKAFKRPVRVVNDAAMQALAHYETGRLLYITLGTSVGATLVADDVVIPMEVGLLRLSKSVGFADRLCKASRDLIGHKAWEKAVWKATFYLRDCFWPDTVIIGGGNAKTLDDVPSWCEVRDNQDTFRGALRLWPGADLYAETYTTTLRIKRRKQRKRVKREK